MSKLEDEIQGDPLGIGYASMTNEEVSDSLNALNRSRNRTSISGREFTDEIIGTEYIALSDSKKGQFLSLVSGDALDPFGFAMDVLVDIFGSSSATVIRLRAFRVETISRAAELGIRDVRAGVVGGAR